MKRFGLPTQSPVVAVVGAGVAGASCARALRNGGCTVRVFDKSFGPGGRLATRRALWVDARGHGRSTRLDHGAPGFDALSVAFRQFTAGALRAGWLAEWPAVFDPRGLGRDGAGPTLLPVPDMPALCRHLLQGIDTVWACPVQALQPGQSTGSVGSGWSLHGAEGLLSEGFDAVVLAMPPAQVGRLLVTHQPAWSRHAALALMQPCWTVMGVSATPDVALNWDVSRPPCGPLCTVQRNEARPCRERLDGEVHWVLHARAAWSRQHLEQSADWAQAQLQAALAEWLGAPLQWHHASAHRWRYAMPQTGSSSPVGRCWWDASLGLGVCGDFLGGGGGGGSGGGGGVEAAWSSAQALAGQILATAPAGRVAWPISSVEA